MTTPKTGAPELVESQADKEETANEALRRIESGSGLFRIEDNDATAPPGSCADGACYIPAATATGAWAGKEKYVAISVGVNAANGWYFIAPEEGMRAWVKDEDAEFAYDGSAWSAYTPASAGSLAYSSLTGVPAAIDAIDGLTPAANKLAYYTGSSAAALTDLSSFGRSLIDDADAAAGRTTLGLGTAAVIDVDTDGTLAANSDAKIATQKAVKTAIAAAVTGLLDFKGNTDCSANPNYPAASKGDAYLVSVAGKIGGGSGSSVDIGDVYVASVDNAGGTQASVGASWFILEHNLTGAALSGAITSSGLTMATARLLGRTTASTGAIEELTAGNGLTLSGGSLVVDYASASDLNTGTDTAKALNSDVFAGSNYGKRFIQLLAGSDYTTALATGDGKAYWAVPSELNGWNVVGVFGANLTRSTSGLPTFQIARIRSGTPVDVLSTKLTIDANEYDSSTAATPAVIDTGNDDLATGDFFRLDCDVAGSSTAGAVVTLIVQAP